MSFSNRIIKQPMNFNGRAIKSQEAVRAFDELCNKNGWIYAKTGYEDMQSNSNEFMNKIKLLDSDTAMRLRFFPDRVLINNLVRLIEIKYSTTIEKTAYDIYIDLSNIGYDVGIAFYMSSITPPHHYEFRYCKISDLCIREPNLWEKTNCNIPIINGLWFAPRELEKTNPEAYWKWKRETGGSGTTYGKIDFVKTPFQIWKL